MKKSGFLFLLILLMLATSIHARNIPRKIIKVELKGKSRAELDQFYKLGLDITAVNRAEKSVNLLVNEEDLAQLSASGFKAEILLADADAFARSLRRSGYLEHFHTYDQMLQEMREIESQFPNIAKMEDIGDSYEKVIDRGGYDIWAIKISDNVAQVEAEPEVLFMANMHAREIITPEIIMYFLHTLIDNYGTDPYITYLVNHRQIYLIPTFNPDGHEYVFSGSNVNDYDDPLWWRKNKRDNNNNGRFDDWYDGVDLNRNFGYKWAYDNQGSSPSPSSNTYRGKSAFSEPESQAIRDFTYEHNFIISLSFHSYSQLWLYPWGYEINLPTPDHEIFVALADCCVAYNNYTAELAAELYPVNGDTDDWLYGEQDKKNKIFAFTPEVGNTAESIGGWSGFFPDTSYIEKQILENQGPMFYLTYIAGEQPIIEPESLQNTENAVGPYAVKAIIKSPPVLTEPVDLIPASFKLYYNTKGLIAPFDSTLMVTTGNPNEYTGSIPGLGENIRIFYYLAAADAKGRTGHAPRVAPAQLFSFAVQADTTPPTILHTPLTQETLQTPAYTITAIIKDNAGIARAFTCFRKNGGAIDTLIMQPTDVPDEFQGQIIPDSVAVGDYFEYKIIAVDQSKHSNQAVSPGRGFYRFQIVPGLLFDFEANNGNFNTSGHSDWEWGIPNVGPAKAYSGKKVWATKLNQNYSNSSNSWLSTPPIDLTGATQATLSFWQWYLNEASQGALWDGGNVKISVNGQPFKIIFPLDGYDGIVDNYNPFVGNEPAFGGPAENGNYWHKVYFDLTPFVNNQVVIAFHFGSDDNTTLPGWYLDDVQILTSQSAIPFISGTTTLPNTYDTVGPYQVSSKITDDSGIQSANLLFSVDTGQNFSPIQMNETEADIFLGEIPGQTFGTTVNYFIKAVDDSGNTATDPPDAPMTTYSFFVTDRAPQMKIEADNFQFTLLRGGVVTDSILIINTGLLDLRFSIRDSLLTPFPVENQFQGNETSVNLSGFSEKVRQAIQTSKFLRNRKTADFSLRHNQQMPPAVESNLIIYDPQADIAGEHPLTYPDITGVYAEKQNDHLSFTIEFAHEVNSDSTFVLLSVDTDQNLNTGGNPPASLIHDLGAEFELFWDVKNTQNMPTASVLILDYSLSKLCGYAPIFTQNNQLSTTIPLSLLGNDDGNMNIGLMAFPDYDETASYDFAPNGGHGVVGFESGVPWISFQPDEMLLGGNDSVFVQLIVNGAIVEPGDYQAEVIFSSNDPQNPEVRLPLAIHFEAVTAAYSKEAKSALPEDFQIHQNYPNPFNPETTVQYELPVDSRVLIRVFNVNGQVVQVLVDQHLDAGYYKTTWNGKNTAGQRLASGIYLLQINAGNFTRTIKMAFIQ